MRFLIAGAQGFIGRYVTAAVLRHAGSCVLGIGRSPRMTGYFSHFITRRGERVRAPLPEGLVADDESRFDYRQIALSDTDTLAGAIREYAPDVVVDLAAALARSPESELAATNIDGTTSLMRAIVSAGARPVVIFGSSGGVYGRLEASQLPVSETRPCSPADPYSASKLAGENAGREIALASGMRFIAVRIFNVAGPGQSEHHLCGRLAALVVEAAESSKEEIRIGALTATRDYVDVRDVATAFVALASSNAPEIVNIASGVETSGLQLLRLMLQAAGLNLRAHQTTEGGIPVGVPRHCGSPERLYALGFRPSFSLERTVGDAYRYYLSL